ncbi:hypothetical protein BGZ52_010809 [Haplosporangium bisporale]|nr:hypothetical protein BGZ52_010809 [Haplosporangium bisporale]
MSLTSADNSKRATLSTPLPEECIQHIFEFLHRDLATLHVLIRVSKTFFRISVPLLYSSPFDLLESNQDWSPQDRTKRHAALLFLLMNCSASPTQNLRNDDQDQKQSIWTDLPPVCTSFQDIHWRLRQPLVDYLALYHHHYLGMNLSSTFPIIFPNIQRYSPPSSSQALLLTNTTITMFTRNEIEKRFLLHQPDQVKTVSLPIQRFAAFRPIVAQLCGLVRFELLGVSWHFDLAPAIDFVHQHSNMYGTIRELKMAGPNDVRALQKPTLREILKAVRHPRELDLSRYKEATKDLNSYDFQNIAGVETLLFSLDYIPPVSILAPAVHPSSFPPPDPSFTPALKVSTSHQGGLGSLDSRMDRTLEGQDNSLRVIHACTGLKHLQIGINSATAFTWALEKFNNDPDSVMPLQVLHISSNTTAIIKRALEDCLRAFQHTLCDLKGVSLKLSAAPLLNPSFGWDWPLNHLSTLSLKGELAVWFDMRSLEFCPKLQELNLTLHPFSPPDPEHLSKIVLAPHLKTLSLVGRWSMTDGLLAHLGTGLSSLENIVLDRCQCDDLSVDGLLHGLDQMLHLKTVQVALEEYFEGALKTYGTNRPTLRISGEDQ